MNSPRNFAEHFTLWVRWRRYIIGVTLGAAVLTFVITCIIPKTYRSTVIVMPPGQTSSSLPFLQGITLDIFGTNEIPATAMEILLRSESLKDSLLKRIDFPAHYKIDDIEKAYLALEAHIEVELESQESFGATEILAFKLHVLDRDPKFAAQLVNQIVNVWDNLYMEMNRRGAMLRREYVENNLHQVGAELATVEDSLRQFQEKFGISMLEPQVTGTISAGIVLQQKVVQARILVDVLGKLFGSDHPDLQRAQLELNGYENALKKFQEQSAEPELTLPTNLAPELGVIYARFFRKIKTLEIIQGILVQNYQQAKMQELRDTPALKIVDVGKTPLHKYKPKRAILSLLAALSAFFMMMILIYFLDYMERNRESGGSQWVDDALTAFRSDLRQWPRIFGIRPKT